MCLGCSFWYVLQWKYCAAGWYGERLPVHKTSAFTLLPLFLSNLLAEMRFGIFYAAKKGCRLFIPPNVLSTWASLLKKCFPDVGRGHLQGADGCPRATLDFPELGQVLPGTGHSSCEY